MNRAIRPLGAAFDFYLPPHPASLFRVSCGVCVAQLGRKNLLRSWRNILGPAVKGGVLSLKRNNIGSPRKEEDHYSRGGLFFPPPFFENLRHPLIVILKEEGFVEILFMRV